MEGNGHDSDISAEQARQRLVTGNERFLNGTSRLRTLTRADFSDLVQGQHPFTTILGCSDSRVPPELIFDTGPGDLFVIRVAGNVFSPEVARSLQYAGSHLNTPLFVVLGHEGCGAVSAALATRDQGGDQHSRIQLLVNAILPGLPQFDSKSPQRYGFPRPSRATCAGPCTRSSRRPKAVCEWPKAARRRLVRSPTSLQGE
jgi:carbonic anhydrase